MNIHNRLGLCIRPNEASTRNKQTLQFRDYRRENQRILPLPKRILRPDRHTYNIPRENRPHARTRNTIVVTRGTKEEHTKKMESVLTKLENECYKASKKKIKILSKRKVWLGHTIAQDEIRPNKEKRKQ